MSIQALAANVAPLETDRPFAEPAGPIETAAGTLDAVSLAGLADEAALLKRVDRKYMASPEQAGALVALLGVRGARALDIDGRRHFRYLSDYFDTADRRLHHDAVSKRRRRFKVRERIYLDSGLRFVEVKTRSGRGHNVKDRLELDPVGPAACRVLAEGYPLPYSYSFEGTGAGDWIAARLEERGAVGPGDGVRIVGELLPTARTRCVRTTLLLPESSRLTIDTELSVAPLYGEREEVGVPFVVIETKSNGRACDADRILWSWGVRPAKVSKSGLAMALGHGERANKWTRALRAVGSGA